MTTESHRKSSHGLDADRMDLYSRQIGAFGIEMMSKLVTMKVLIVGMKGIGVECAKNLILAGPHTVTIHDDEPVSIEDLGTNFYLHESSIGQPRARSCVEQLATLNPYVNVSVHSGGLSEAVWSQYHVIVYANNCKLSDLKAVNKFCRESVPSKPFIYASNWGVTSSIFSDFGHEHVITDPNGEPTKMCVISDISAEGVVTVSADRHGFDDGDVVKFEEVEGMSELNSVEEPFLIKRVYRKKYDGKTILVPNQFKIDFDVSSFSAYTSGGIATQVNVPLQKTYKSLEESCIRPVAEGDWALPHMDMNKMLEKNRGAQLHFAKLAIWEFQERNKGELPRLHSLADADSCVELAKTILESHRSQEDALVVEEIDEDVVRNMALYARAELTPFSAFVGGVVAQEIVKFPGKFTPLNQWLHHDSFELLQESVPEDSTSRGSRYDWQINVFGYSFQEKLFRQKWFLVGAGALGCEYIKGIALMGVGAEGGVVHLTDMDRIEISNLNRQFLFRRDNVGQPKSVAAANAAKKMNPALRIKCHEIPVGPDTEDQFDEEFWSGLDGVWNALDNVKARKYTDTKCVFYGKPLLESGTLGTKANSEVILPHKTTCYNDHKESDEDGIPMCTLRNFPHFIEHCIEWARAQFSELFEDSAQNLNSLIRDPEAYFAQIEKEGNAAAQLEPLQKTKSLFDRLRNGTSIELCVELALNEFTKQYRDRISDLVHLFPEDSRKVDKYTKEDLGAFWSGEKRFPQSAEFDISDELHLDYVYNSANLFAFMFGIKSCTDRNVIRNIAAGLVGSIEAWKPKTHLSIEIEEEDFKKQDDSIDHAKEVEILKSFFRNQDLSKFAELYVADFEKDDDSNFHIDFITSCSNLRAWNYRIKQATRHKCKMIAGKIIPALATTTAMITGLVELELYKIVLDLDASKFCNTNVNLAVNQFQSFEPLEPRKAKAEHDPIMFADIVPIPDGFTVWDKIVIREGDLSVEQFLAALKKQHFDVHVNLLYQYGITQKTLDEGRGHAIYNSNPWLPAAIKEKQQKHLRSNLKELYEELYGPLSSGKCRFLLLDGDFECSGEACKIPLIVYYFS